MKALFAALIFAFLFSVLVPTVEAAPVKHHKLHKQHHHHHQRHHKLHVK